MNLKFTYIFLILLIVFAACGDDGNSERALRYIDTQSGIVDFKMYVGSDEGGIEFDIDSLKKKVDAFFPSTLFESYTSTSVSFTNDEIIIEQSSIYERFKYKFEDGSLYINKEGGELRYFGDGDQNALDIRQHYIGYKSGDEAYHLLSSIPIKTISKDTVAAQTPFAKVAAMTNTGDTLIWCTRRATFR